MPRFRSFGEFAYRELACPCYACCTANAELLSISLSVKCRTAPVYDPSTLARRPSGADGIHLSRTGEFLFEGSPVSVGETTTGASNPTIYGTGGLSLSSGMTPIPCVRMCLLAFETTENVRVQPG